MPFGPSNNVVNWNENTKLVDPIPLLRVPLQEERVVVGLKLVPEVVLPLVVLPQPVQLLASTFLPQLGLV